MTLHVSLKSVVYLIAAVAVSWILIHLLPVVLVIVVALLVFGTLEPAVEWLEGHRVKRGIAIGVVFTSTLLGVLLLLAATIPSLISQATQLIEKAPAFRGSLADHLTHSGLGSALGNSVRQLRFEELAKLALSGAFAYSGRIVEILAYGASAIFLGLYLMLDRDRLRGALFSLVPRNHHVRLARVLLNLETIVGSYIRGQVITSGLMALFTFSLLTACGVESALALAAFAGLADALPYIGVFLSVGPAAIASISRGPAIVAIVLGAMLVYEELESRFLVPRIYGRVLRLPSSVILVALLAGGTLMGVLGALLALPVAAAIRMLIIELRIELPGENARDPALEAQERRVEECYRHLAEGVPVAQAAALAVEIALDPKNQKESVRDDGQNLAP
jgi:predicted PurR-regulated permease PerM